jgi:uncharacterized Fe-S cluster-containing radical SAM superfamily protein
MKLKNKIINLIILITFIIEVNNLLLMKKTFQTDFVNEPNSKISSTFSF